jgi:biotin transport system substrate-specific component
VSSSAVLSRPVLADAIPGARVRDALLFIAGALLTAACAQVSIHVPWLKVSASLSWGSAIDEGFTIFILGGVIKAALAGLLMPSAWRLLGALDR